MDSTRQADPYGRGSYCIVVALHGDDSREAAALRSFRDDVLKELPLGDRLVSLYYRVSPAATRFLSSHSRARSLAAASISATASFLARY